MDLKDKEQKRKFRVVIIATVLLLLVPVLLFLLNHFLVVDPRGKASTPVAVGENVISASFDKTNIPIYKKGQVSLDIIMDSQGPVSSASVYFRYPKGYLELDPAASGSVSDSCLSKYPGDILSENLGVSDDNGLVKITRVSMEGNDSLPHGKFCFATVVLDLKDGFKDYPKSLDFGFENNTTDWKAFRNGELLYPQIADANPSITPHFTLCYVNDQGDATCDNNIDLEDFEMFRSDFMKYKNVPIKDNTYITTDFARDGKIDIEDFEVFRTGFIKLSKNLLPHPTTTVIASVSTSVKSTPSSSLTCNWCGNICGAYRPGIECPQVAPPEGQICQNVESVCKAVNTSN